MKAKQVAEDEPCQEEDVKAIEGESITQEVHAGVHHGEDDYFEDKDNGLADKKEKQCEQRGQGTRITPKKTLNMVTVNKNSCD